MTTFSPDGFVGVIGGVGPGATAVFMDALVRATKAASDQEHINALVAQHPAIPDRTAHILDPDSHENPGPYLARDAVFLENAGAAFLVLPCNTAHHYASLVDEATSIDLLSIVHATVTEVAERVQPGEGVAILATAGNIEAQVYQDALESAGFKPIVPTAAEQDVVNALIYDQVKAGRPADLEALRGLVDVLSERGARAVVFGCTELSLVFDKEEMQTDRRIVDSLRELTRATVLRAGKSLSESFR